MAVGVNLNICRFGSKSIHAEINAVSKLNNSTKSSGNNICLVSLRFSKNGELRNAKPCRNCVKNTYKLAKKKGYLIKTVIYSMDGELIKVRFDTLLDNLEECYMSSGTKGVF